MTENITDDLGPEEEPKKKKRGRPKKKIPKPTDDSLIPPEKIQTYYVDADNLDEIDDPELKDFLSKLISDTIENPPEIQKKKRRPSEDMLMNILSEYMNGFVLVGYDTQGNRMSLKYAKNDSQEDALIEQLRCIFIKMMS